MPSSLPPVDAAALKPWLIRHLEPICDADPPVLADYILALLKHDVPVPELRKLCVSQLEDFLDRHTAPFVDTLIAHLSGSSPSAAPAPAPAPVPAAAPAPKRSAREASLTQERGSPKQARRGPEVEMQNGRGAGGQDVTGNGSNGAPRGPGGRAPPTGPAARKGKTGEPCRDYHFRGFCPLGVACPNTHDLPPGVPPPTGAGPGGPVGPMGPGAPFPPFFPPGAAAAMAAAAQGMGMPFPPPGFPPFAPGPGGPGFPGGGRGMGPAQRGGRAPRGRGGAPFAAAGPGGAGHGGGGGGGSSRISTRLILVDNIPPASLTEQAVRHFFTPFGSIVALALNAEARKAEVLYDHPRAADKAVRSEQAVFGNRFVRVYRLAEERVELLRAEVAALPPLPPPGQGQQGEEGATSPPPQQPQHKPILSGPPSTLNGGARAFRPAPRPRTSSTTNAAAALTTRLQQITEKQKTLLSEVDAADAQRKKALMAALRALGTEADEIKGKIEKAKLERERREVEGDGMEVDGQQQEEMDPREKLRRLKEEAAALGLDPSNPTAPPSYPPSKPYQKRPYAPPAARRPPGAFRLDNRTSGVIIAPAPVREGEQEDEGRKPLTGEKEAEVRRHFEAFGTLTAVDFDTPSQGECVVKFGTRKDAERAMAAGPSPLASLLSTGPLSLRWEGQPPPSAPPPLPSASNGADTKMPSREERSITPIEKYADPESYYHAPGAFDSFYREERDDE
ncbi:hypothetical protein JCM10213_006748 [Rhodosporidiobolus nylandii]